MNAPVEPAHVTSVRLPRGRKDGGLPRFPATRFHGSKRKILGALATLFSELNVDRALDLYAGSGSVTLLLRHLGIRVDANDYQQFARTAARLFLQATRSGLCGTGYQDELHHLLSHAPRHGRTLVADHYRGVFFRDCENAQIDRFAQNVASRSGMNRDLYIYAVGQALLKKRPYNLFHRANLAMRERDVERSFGNAVTWDASIFDHALKAIDELRRFPFADVPNGRAFGVNTMNLAALPDDYDLVYLDPPYINSRSVAVDYSDFYGFLEGLCDYELFATGDARYAHRPIARKPTRWKRAADALEEVSEVCGKWRSSVIVMSYRSDGLPTPDAAREALATGGRKVQMRTCGAYRYALSGNAGNEELLLVSVP